MPNSDKFVRQLIETLSNEDVHHLTFKEQSELESLLDFMVHVVKEMDVELPKQQTYTNDYEQNRKLFNRGGNVVFLAYMIDNVETLLLMTLKDYDNG